MGNQESDEDYDKSDDNSESSRFEESKIARSVDDGDASSCSNESTIAKVLPLNEEEIKSPEMDLIIKQKPDDTIKDNK